MSMHSFAHKFRLILAFVVKGTHICNWVSHVHKNACIIPFLLRGLSRALYFPSCRRHFLCLLTRPSIPTSVSSPAVSFFAPPRSLSRPHCLMPIPLPPSLPISIAVSLSPVCNLPFPPSELFPPSTHAHSR